MKNTNIISWMNRCEMTNFKHYFYFVPKSLIPAITNPNTKEIRVIVIIRTQSISSGFSGIEKLLTKLSGFNKANSLI